mmetsp:Transcript_16494/g.46922  ORF Transcript_16494/g.46922 Transcript_16494/m.46922 type:complete len:216 (-) Transcript_16494:639-1286(-)
MRVCVRVCVCVPLPASPPLPPTLYISRRPDRWTQHTAQTAKTIAMDWMHAEKRKGEAEQSSQLCVLRSSGHERHDLSPSLCPEVDESLHRQVPAHVMHTEEQHLLEPLVDGEAVGVKDRQQQRRPLPHPAALPQTHPRPQIHQHTLQQVPTAVPQDAVTEDAEAQQAEARAQWVVGDEKPPARHREADSRVLLPWCGVARLILALALIGRNSRGV